jgi:lipopolysaccharide/colanic/teichoic acid biosynthesis glycosyltransferase
MTMTGHSGSAARVGGFAPTTGAPTSGHADVVSLDAYRAEERGEERLSVHTFVRSVGPYDRFGKRLIDFLGAAILLVVFAPVMATVALAVRLTMGAKVLFFQDRVGRNGRTFRMVKFRSMRHDRRAGDVQAAPFDGVDRRLTHKTSADPRHTKVGRFIRKWSLDELPQLFNVLKGDMSLVGPRPELVQVAERYGLVDHPRHCVRPGITGLWQVSKSRGSLLHENVHIDLDYVGKVTLLGDIRILLRTVSSVVKVRGS